MKLWKWWDQLPGDVQKALLVTLVVLGGTRAGCQYVGPIICDPAPPPPTTPMICDPPPPPATVWATPYPTVTVAPGQHFIPQIVEMSADPAIYGALIRGTAFGQDGQPLPGLPVVVRGEGWEVRAVSDRDGFFSVEVASAGTYLVYVEGDEDNALTIALTPQAVVTVNLQETWDESHAPLPLAEVRSVRIDWQGGLTFAARSPWPGARCRWSVSGGVLIDGGEQVTWQPPAEPGRYLLQVVADWGWRGLAVDTLTLTVDKDGNAHLS